MPCNQAQGTCPGYCGVGGACCKLNFEGAPAECGRGSVGCLLFHCCVAAAAATTHHPQPTPPAHKQQQLLLLPHSARPPPPPTCIPAMKACHDAPHAACCGDHVCVRKNAHYAQCRPSCPMEDDWECHRKASPPPPLPPPPPAVLKALPRSGLTALVTALERAALSGELVADDALAAALPGSAWQVRHNLDACAFSAFSFSGPTRSPLLLTFTVPWMQALMKTRLGLLGVNLCGPASPPKLPTAGLHGAPPAIITDPFSVKCSQLSGGTQTAFLMRTRSHAPIASGPPGSFGCRPFGAAPPELSLLSRAHPARGIQIRASAGPPCAEGRASSVTVMLRCDSAHVQPVLKNLQIKEGCDLELGLVGADGCPSASMIPPGSGSGARPHKCTGAVRLREDGSVSDDDDDVDDSGEGGDDDDDDDDDDCAEGEEGEESSEEGEEGPADGEGCIGGESGCTLSLLLDPSCNPECANDECFWDNGACHQETMGCKGCLPSWLGDGACDDECFTEACSWDGGDCVDSDDRFVTPQRARCAEECPASWQGDGECDPACNLQACMYDDGDCAPASCLLALPTLTGGRPLLVTSEASMGLGDATGGAPDPEQAMAEGVTGPPVPAAGTVWYDLSSIGLQSLTIPEQSMTLPDKVSWHVGTAVRTRWAQWSQRAPRCN